MVFGRVREASLGRSAGVVLAKGYFRRGVCRGEKQYPYGSSWHLGGSSGTGVLLALEEGQQPGEKKLVGRQDWTGIEQDRGYGESPATSE